MSVTARARKVEEEVKLDFKDVLIRPRPSNVKSRADVRVILYPIVRTCERRDRALKRCCCAHVGGLAPDFQVPEFEGRVLRRSGDGVEYGHNGHVRNGHRPCESTCAFRPCGIIRKD